MMPQARDGIHAEGLVREFKNGPRAVDGIDLAVRGMRAAERAG